MEKMLLAIMLAITLSAIIIPLVDAVMHYTTGKSYSQDYQDYQEGDGIKM